MAAYYNEIDPHAAEWLRALIKKNLIAPGDVDTRSIKDVKPCDLAGYRQCHFFAGIGGWSYALRLAGWHDDRAVWTGSCPCQPYSAAGKGEGDKDPRNLWPDFYRLIRECRPDVCFGEQVPAAIGHGWLDGISRDLEAESYSCGSVVLGAHSVGAPHIRQRLYWVAISDERRHDRRESSAISSESPKYHEIKTSSGDSRLAVTNIAELSRIASTGELSVHQCSNRHGGLEHSESDRRDEGRAESVGRITASGCSDSGVVDTNNAGPQRRRPLRSSVDEFSAWSDSVVIACLDGKSRRVGRSVQPLANGIPRDMGRGIPELWRLAKRARSNRTGRLKGYGNAIVPQVAAEFITAYLETQPPTLWDLDL